MKKFRLILIAAVVGLVGVGIIAVRSFVTAQDAGQGLTVSPPSQEVSVDPGGTVTVKAKLRNPGNTSLPIEVHIEDFTAKGDEGQVELTANSPYSVVSWTKVSPSNFTLGPGETKEVTAVIKAPGDAAGGHFGSFIFAVKPANDNTGSAASLSQEIASLFLVKVSGPVDEKLSLKSFTAPTYSEFGPIQFNLEFVNDGNVHTKTYGLINVSDMFGNKVADVVVRGTNIFPGATRNVKASLDKKFLFGPYKVSALMYYGSNNDVLTMDSKFFVFPTRIVVGIIVVLFVLYLMRKRLKKSMKALFG